MKIMMQGPDKHLEEGDVLAYLGIGSRALKKLIDEKKFPPPLCLSDRRVWPYMDLVAFWHMLSRIGEPMSFDFRGLLEEKRENS